MSTVQAKKINIVQAINMALHDAMELDSSVVVLGEDIADPFISIQRSFPSRVRSPTPPKTE